MSYVPSRKSRPCEPGDTVRVLDRFDGIEYTGVVQEVRWDSWLKDAGEWRLFIVIAGKLHLHYHGSELITEDGHRDLLDALADVEGGDARG